MALKASFMDVFGGRENRCLKFMLKIMNRWTALLEDLSAAALRTVHLAELRKKEYYQSPSVKRRKKSEAARKNRNKRYY